jgi:hypothetical protein
MQLNFTQVILRKIERDAESGKLHFSASLTAKVIEAMGWGDLPEGATGAKMEGELSGGNLLLSPKEDGIRAEIDVAYATVGHFEIIRLETPNSRGKGRRNELRFIVRFGGSDVAAKAEAWFQKMGDGAGVMKINYSKQETLPGTEVEQPA